MPTAQSRPRAWAKSGERSGTTGGCADPASPGIRTISSPPPAPRSGHHPVAAQRGQPRPDRLLGFDAGTDAGLDIYSTLTNGRTTANDAFASLWPYNADTPSLYSVNVLTGEPTSIGQFPLDITDLAISLTGS